MPTHQFLRHLLPVQLALSSKFKQMCKTCAEAFSGALSHPSPCSPPTLLLWRSLESFLLCRCFLPTYHLSRNCYGINSFSTWWKFRPEKKYSAPPPQFAADTLLAPRSHPPPRRHPSPPSWDKKKPTPPQRRLGIPFPLPRAEKKKYPKRPPSQFLRCKDDVKAPENEFS